MHLVESNQLFWTLTQLLSSYKHTPQTQIKNIFPKSTKNLWDKNTVLLDYEGHKNSNEFCTHQPLRKCYSLNILHEKFNVKFNKTFI